MKKKNAPNRLGDVSTSRPLNKTRRALFEAVKRGDVESIRKLIRQGANVNLFQVPKRGYAAMSPLMQACYDGNLEIVKLLLDAGADVEATSEELAGTTALYYAVTSVKRDSIPDIVEILLKRGANPNRRIKSGKGNVFVASIRTGASEVVKTLVRAGADVRGDAETPKFPLLEAATVGDLQIVEELLANGADPNAKNTEGWTALITASERGYPDIVRVLLQKGADPNAISQDGESAMTRAADRIGSCYDQTKGDAYLRILKQLVEAGVDPNTKNSDGWTALDLAEHNAMKDHEFYGPRWYSGGGEYLQAIGAKRSKDI